MSAADSSDTTDMLVLLREHYGVASPPAPSAALSARMETGVMAHDMTITDTPTDELATRRRDRGGVTSVLERARRRTRYAVAGLAAAFVATSGLAAAGALPGAVQREVSSVVSHLGIDLPSPIEHPASRSGTDTPGVVPTHSTSAAAEPTSPSSIAPSDSVAPGGASESTPTTLPGTGLGTDPLLGVVPSVPVEPVTPPTVVLPVIGSEELPVPATTLPLP